jgi:flagellar biosynthetic protein FlhB
MVDYAFEKYNYMKKMRMTKREQKEETKEREGNPEVKQKIKSMQKELARKRMMSEIQSADAIVANPTHFSVAIKYDKDRMVAPKVVAKGIDFLALKIRDIAKDSQVPIIENVKLARNLYYNVEVGEEVPRSFYKAVAEILAYVYKLKKKKQALEMV